MRVSRYRCGVRLCIHGSAGKAWTTDTPTLVFTTLALAHAFLLPLHPPHRAQTQTQTRPCPSPILVIRGAGYTPTGAQTSIRGLRLFFQGVGCRHGRGYSAHMGLASLRQDQPTDTLSPPENFDLGTVIGDRLAMHTNKRKVRGSDSECEAV